MASCPHSGSAFVPSSPPPYPGRRVSVVDTPIVRAAQAYAQLHCSPSTYNHIMRTWLYGVLILSHDPELASQVDLEVHALGLMLHDLASLQSLDAPFLTLHRRFEVDSAVAAADFIRSHPDGKDWPDYRVQRVWDGIALHAEPSIALHKEPDVVAIYWGNELDFSWTRPGGEQKGVTKEEYEKVLAEFPQSTDTRPGGILGFIAWWCKYKPETTYSERPKFFRCWVKLTNWSQILGCSRLGSCWFPVIRRLGIGCMMRLWLQLGSTRVRSLCDSFRWMKEVVRILFRLSVLTHEVPSCYFMARVQSFVT